MKNSQISVAFGDKVRELRKEKGLSQEELSFKADLHRTYIGMIERAEKNITLINIEKIANALGVPVHMLFKSEEEAQNVYKNV
ncbi:MAG: helix-turn-helix transcriptional regulator [Bacteroidota bacterium]